MITPAKEDICYATQNRQDAVKQLALQVDLVLVIGSKNSENSNQLVKVARALGKPAYLIDDQSAIDAAMVAWHFNSRHHFRRIGAGTTGPTSRGVFSKPRRNVEQLGMVEENIHFALPSEVTGIQ